jgi:hypothetical protein
MSREAVGALLTVSGHEAASPGLTDFIRAGSGGAVVALGLSRFMQGGPCRSGWNPAAAGRGGAGRGKRSCLPAAGTGDFRFVRKQQDDVSGPQETPHPGPPGGRKRERGLVVRPGSLGYSCLFA